MPLGLDFDGRWFLAGELVAAGRPDDALALLRDCPRQADRIAGRTWELEDGATPGGGSTTEVSEGRDEASRSNGSLARGFPPPGPAPSVTVRD